MASSGQNRGYIDELYRSFLRDPKSVSAAWRDYFADYRLEPAPRPSASTAAANKKPEKTPPAAGSEPLRGVAARIAENMAASLEVPTATSARTIPVKLLEENRRRLNLHQSTVAAPKISFTHLIAWAVTRALQQHPGLSARFEEIDGEPHRVPADGVHLGVAIDVERKGKRVLLVPNIKHAEQLDFPAFVRAMNERIAGARDNRLTVEDFQGTAVTLTNPGMIGTALSVPRLMQGQGAIIGVGSIGYSAEFAGMNPTVISELGISKVMTVTSTYDHRIVQGAESGAFLKTLGQLLQGEQEFYGRVFSEFGVPHEPIGWDADRNPPAFAGGGDLDAIAKQAGVFRLIRGFRVRGHLWADLDPLGYEPEPHPELELSHHGLTVWDLDRRFVVGELDGEETTTKTLREILDTLQRAYCRHIGVEYMHIQDPIQREWLQKRIEADAPETIDRDTQIRILKKLNAAEAFESFIGTNYVGQKRFSLEGAETLIPMLDQLLIDAADNGVEEVVIGMAHRGRLNVLSNTIGKSNGQIFAEFEGHVDPGTAHGSGDVKYHLGASGSFEAPSGATMRVAVASNPSHLEAVNPVVEGMVRALQDQRDDHERARVVPILIHGDAAFAGQGVVAETLNLSGLKGYRTGGTVHLIVNNQIGFTTGPADARSSHYPTDVAKMVDAPVFHVNGDHPESAVRVIRDALAYRQAFKRDIVVDLVCYRRWGHNEADDPSYTHPQLYAKIEHHRSVRKLYTDQLLRRGDFDIDTAEKALEDFRRRLREVHDEVRQAQSAPPTVSRDDLEATAGTAVSVGEGDSELDGDRLSLVIDGLARVPDGFRIHPKLVKQLKQRRERFDEDRIDWALAEALAFGSLVLEGTPVRLSGEDSGRGTFSQRHSVLYDFETAEPHIPLDHLDADQARFQVFDSLLSEFALLGFEYGYSVSRPDALVLWEAQFGDFVNGAQVIIDQFLSSAEEKWNQTSGVALLLPHGYEGQGPEHSSARPERFLQLAARGNVRVAYPSTPGQYFHLLRDQARCRKPLIVMTPKSLLRHRECVSSRERLVRGRFRLTLDDPRKPAAADVERLVLCSGKIYYDLDAQRQKQETGDVAICRLEQVYPFPRDEIAALLETYPGTREIVWAQEEPRNMGFWTYLSDRLGELLPGSTSLRYIGRPRSASPATGSFKRHAAEQEAIVVDALTLGRRNESGVVTPSGRS